MDFGKIVRKRMIKYVKEKKTEQKEMIKIEPKRTNQED